MSNWNYLKLLARDKMSISRKEEVKVGPITRFQEVSICTDEVCKYSISSIPSHGLGDIPKLVTITKVFCSPRLTIRPGDSVTITRQDGTVRKGVVGDVGCFPDSHLVFVVTEELIA